MIENGGQGRNRTADASLFRAALYQLSYLAGFAEARFLLILPVSLLFVFRTRFAVNRVDLFLLLLAIQV